MSKILKDKKVAIIFYGLTRSLNRTVDSIKENLFAPLHNNGMSYDIFIHKVEEQHIPDLSDEFAKSVDPEVKNLDELKNKVSTNINQSFENEHIKSINSAIIDYFVN